MTSESGWNPLLISDHGDYGLVQISIGVNNPGITKEQAFDPIFALKFAATAIKKGQEYKWTVCSCVQQIKALGVKVPKGWNASDFKPNTTPHIGAVAIFNYHGVSHVALIKKYTSKGFLVAEGNYESCKTGDRDISWDDPSLIGFWDPADG